MNDVRAYSWNDAARWERLAGGGRLINDKSELTFKSAIPSGPRLHINEFGSAARLAKLGNEALKNLSLAHGLAENAAKAAFSPAVSKGGRPFLIPSFDEAFRRYFRDGSGWHSIETMWTDKARVLDKKDTKVYQDRAYNEIIDRIPLSVFESEGYIVPADGTFIPAVRLALPYGCGEDERYKCQVAVRHYVGHVDAGGYGLWNYSATWLCLVESVHHEERLKMGQVPAVSPLEYNDETAIVRRTSLLGLGRVETSGRGSLKANFTGLGFECPHDDLGRGVLCVRVTHRLPLLYAILAASDDKSRALGRTLGRL